MRKVYSGSCPNDHRRAYIDKRKKDKAKIKELEGAIDQILMHKDQPTLIQAFAHALKIRGRDTYYAQ